MLAAASLNGILGSARVSRAGDGVLAITNFPCYKSSKIDMSTIAEIQEAIEKLPANEKSALAVSLQSQEEPIISEAEEKALLARLDKAAAELDVGKGVSLARVREKIRGWAGE
jgi:hypothetical protein